MLKFKIFLGPNQEWNWELRTDKNKVLIVSEESYTTLARCFEVIDQVKVMKHLGETQMEFEAVQLKV